MSEEYPWVTSIEDAPTGKFVKRNPRPYRAFINDLIATVNPDTGISGIGNVTVTTGDMTVIGRKHRGVSEHDDELAFREAARERGVGLRVNFTHQPSLEKTDFRIQIRPKKELPADKQAERNAKLAAGRAKKKAEKEAAAKAAEAAQAREDAAKANLAKQPVPAQGATKKA